MNVSVGARVGIGATMALGVGGSIGANLARDGMDRGELTTLLNLGGASAGIVGLGLGALGPAALRPLGVGIGIVGAAAFIGSQLLMPHVESPSAE